MKYLHNHLLLPTLLAFCSCDPLSAQIFITSKVDKMIETANLDGSDHRVFLRMDQIGTGTNGSGPDGIAATRDAIYWGGFDAWRDASIYTCRLDGSGSRPIADWYARCS